MGQLPGGFAKFANCLVTHYQISGAILTCVMQFGIISGVECVHAMIYAHIPYMHIMQAPRSRRRLEQS